MTTFDLTPTPAEYLQVGRLFTQQILADIKQPRKQPAGELLASVIKIAAYFGSTHDLEAVETLAFEATKEQTK